MRCAVSVAIFLIATSPVNSKQTQQSAAQPNQPQQTPAAPVGKVRPLTPTQQKSSYCKQHAKEQDEAMEKLLTQIRALQDQNLNLWQENQRLTSLNSAEQDALDKAFDSMKKSDELFKKQQQLMDKTTKDALAAGMVFSEVTGKWAIQTSATKVTCSVQVYYEYRTIQLSYCQ